MELQKGQRKEGENKPISTPAVVLGLEGGGKEEAEDQ